MGDDGKKQPKKIGFISAETVDALGNAILNPLGVPWGLMLSVLDESRRTLKDAEGKTISALKEEAQRQKIVMAVQTHQAQLTQELAIAHRIALSDEVEIEEFYDQSGKGGAGVQMDETGANFGVTGEGRKVTKRVIKFRGWGPAVDAAPDAVPDADTEPKSP